MNNVIEMLKAYPNINKDILRLNEELRLAVKSQLTIDSGLKSNVITGLPHADGERDPVYENVSRTFENMVYVSKEIKKLSETAKYQIKKKISMKNSIDKAIDQLNYEEQTIIKLRYMDYPEPQYKWDKIAKESCYSIRQCQRKHDEAIINLAKIIKKMS